MKKAWYEIIMFRIIKKMFIILSSFGESVTAKCLSLNNQPCQVRPTIIDVNSNEHFLTICC